MGNKEMSALKYGIIYWAKIDPLIASRHIDTRSFKCYCQKKPEARFFRESFNLFVMNARKQVFATGCSFP